MIVLVASLALAVLATTLPNLPGAPCQPLGARLAPLGRPAVARLVLAVFLCGAGGLMFYTYLAPLLAQAGLSRQHLPLVLLEVGVIGVPSAFLGGWLADTYGADEHAWPSSGAMRSPWASWPHSSAPGSVGPSYWTPSPCGRCSPGP